ncbi:MAG: hypothetical protein MK008_02150 [Bdellovibrionales bacterium]|nr:hypothetical protein [Bdellovibrionales bacterium]
MYRFLLVLFLFFSAHSVYAQDSGCFGKLCVYYPKNTAASELAEYVKKAITGSELFHINQQSGFLIAKDSIQEISYFFTPDNEYGITNQDVTTMLQHYDRMTSFHLKKRIKFDLMIYKIKESKLKEIGLNAYGEARTYTPSTSPSEIPSQPTGAISGLVGLGNLTTNLLRIKLDLAKSSAEAMEVLSLPFEQENFSSISISKKETLYRDAGSSFEVKTEDAGLSIGGSVQLVEDQGETKVRVNNFSLNYSVPSENKESLVQSINVYNDYILSSGVPRRIFKENIKEQFDGESRLPGLNWLIGSSEKSYNSKLIVVLSAEIIGQPKAQPETPAPPVQDLTEFFQAFSANIVSDYNYSFWQRIHLKFPELESYRSYEDVVVKIEMDGDGLQSVPVHYVPLRDLINFGLSLPSFKLENQHLKSKLFFRVKFSLDNDFAQQDLSFKSQMINFYYLPENRYIKAELE